MLGTGLSITMLKAFHGLMDDFKNPEEKVQVTLQRSLTLRSQRKARIFLTNQGVEGSSLQNILSCVLCFDSISSIIINKHDRNRKTKQIQNPNPTTPTGIMLGIMFFTYTKIYLEQNGIHKTLANLVSLNMPKGSLFN